MSDYLIKNDVYFCYAGTQIVFLDLERNKYSAIDRSLAPSLTGIVGGWATSDSGASSLGAATNGKKIEKQVAESLLERGILTRSQENGKKAAPTRLANPTTDLVKEYDLSKSSISLLHIVRFIRSYLYAVVALRIFSLAGIVRRIRVQKMQVGQQVQYGSVSEARELVRIYDQLRPFFFQSSQKCLLNSLVLIEFMRHYNVHPTWVIGVTTGPFRAHSWLELNGAVVDDFEIHVKNYVPIMAQ